MCPRSDSTNPSVDPGPTDPEASSIDPDHPLEGALSWRDFVPIGIAAVVALLLGGGLLAVFGRVSPYDRPEVFDGLATVVYWLAASIIGACSTITALMLTTLGLLEHLETHRLTPRFLFHLRLIVTAALVTIALAVLALLLTVFPTSGAGEATPDEGQLAAAYWALLIVTALMIGGFTTVLGGLFTTIGDIFRTLPRSWVEDIVTETTENGPAHDSQSAEKTSTEMQLGATQRQ